MQILEKILFATDFTQSNDNAIESAIRMSKTFHSKIVLVHVLPKDIGNKKAKALLDSAAHRELKKLQAHLNEKGAQTETPILEYGDHLDRIIKTSERIDANMILIGAGEKSKNETFRLGTTARRIIQKSDKPVMVIQGGKFSPIHNILCPVDFSEESKRALKNAMVMARRYDAELTILNAYDQTYKSTLTDLIDWDGLDETLLKKQTKSFDKFLVGLNLAGLKWTKKIERGDSAEIILKTIAEENTDLLVIGTTGRKGLSKFLIGSVTEKVIREVPCSFMTLKMEDLIAVKLEKEIKDIETHFGNAKQLVKDGMFKDALIEYNACLRINKMHTPSLNAMAFVYEFLGEKDQAEKYRYLAEYVTTTIANTKIEAEARRFVRK